ncbi:tRNA (adenosine(37)-N6)-threonylcarbamoyltransferase complex dimerization subunit type 1 TsaB [Clostridium senegalense]|uniref:tRNA (adenosine(37)-N6)-threonylcarbamoyltransferase complex dimerization subunit type 1 TsaB n=1 Tax=Clostridium senegalense TaxID=1465809 RepID=UPI0002883C36|nr:tRNA (adenosine(37)-N6)-threonylcarbamoyltransferase complex dimerization subunit type 1 TsaB [Clostridium senegalense]
MIILSLDCATECATAALLKNDAIIGEININNKKQHSSILMPMIDQLFKNTNLTLNDVDGFVVSKGPGSFTGLRVGMSTIKGLAQALNKPFVSVSTLDGLANNLYFADGLICPIMDALRGNVYTALYNFENNNLKALTEPMILSIEDLIQKIKEKNKKVYFIGDGTFKYQNQLLSSISNCYIAPCHLNVAKASSLGEVGLNLLNKGITDDIYTSAPLYLRLSQAEREYEERMKNNG